MFIGDSGIKKRGNFLICFFEGVGGDVDICVVFFIGFNVISVVKYGLVFMCKLVCDMGWFLCYVGYVLVVGDLSIFVVNICGLCDIFFENCFLVVINVVF